MRKLTIEAQVPDDKDLESGLPLLLQMMEGAGMTFINVSLTIPVTTEPPARERRSRTQKALAQRLAAVEDELQWVKETFIGVEDDVPSTPTSPKGD